MPTLTGTTNPITKTYPTIGTKTASVKVTSGSQTANITCTPVTVADDVCNNFTGTQTVVPAGFTVNTAGNCACNMSYTLTVQK